MTPPPTSGPSATAMPLMPDQTPSATPRRSGGNASASSVSVSGVTIGGADALRRARCDQQADARRQGGSRRGDREQRQAGDEDAPAAEAIAERGAGQQQHGVGEHVGVDGPFQRLDRGAQVAVDARQRDADDEVVEHDHEQPDGNDPEGPASAVACCRLRHPAASFLVSANCEYLSSR